MNRQIVHCLLLVVLTALVQVTPGEAAIIPVPCPTLFLTAIVASAAPGDTVVIPPCSSPYPANLSIASKDRVHIVAAKNFSPLLVGAGIAGTGISFPSNPRPVIDGGGSPCLTISNSTRVSVSGLTFQHCGSYGVGIFTNSDSVKLHDNLISADSDIGIWVEESDTPIITSNWILQVMNHGIYLNNTNSPVVADNTVLGPGSPGATGIYADIGTSFGEILRNNVRYSFGAGIRDEGTGTRISRNTALVNCVTPMPCVCDQIVVGTSSTSADVVGNETAGGISFCGLGTGAADNI